MDLEFSHDYPMEGHNQGQIQDHHRIGKERLVVCIFSPIRDFGVVQLYQKFLITLYIINH